MPTLHVNELHQQPYNSHNLAKKLIIYCIIQIVEVANSKKSDFPNARQGYARDSRIYRQLYGLWLLFHQHDYLIVIELEYQSSCLFSIQGSGRGL